MYKEAIELVAQDEDKGKRLDAFISENISHLTRSYIQNLIESEDIKVKGKKKIKSGLKLKGNEVIIVSVPEEKELEVEAENIPIDIVYQDKHMVIINKEPNVVVHPAPGNYTGTLVNAVMYHIKDLSSINGVIRPGIVHRLDKDTSGLIIIAKTDQAHVKLAEMFVEKTIDKYYVAVVKGSLAKESGRIENHIGRNPVDRKKMTVVERNGKRAISNYYQLDKSDKHTLVLVGIETGRTHQIRVHMKHIGHPIEGDQVYSKTNKYAKRQMLHAYLLRMNHPITGEEMIVKGKLPYDFEEVLTKLHMKLDDEKVEEIVLRKK